MFVLAILIGIYSYLIFILGILAFLTKPAILATTLLFLVLSIFIIKPKVNISIFKITKSNLTYVFLVLAIVTVNFIGVLGPELSFDSLWYHLTLPKLFLEKQSIFFIEGGLFYYSVMPKLVDLLYLLSILFFNETMAKFIHFSFGILTSLAIYKLSRKFFDQKLSLIASLIFYSNLVVGWQSITAYIDLGRTFFEFLALFAFINWFETKNTKWLVTSGMMLGLAISSKLIALGSLFIFSVLIFYALGLNKANILDYFKKTITFFSVSLFMASPWFLFAFLSTGNPFYPIFSEVYRVELSSSLINPINIVRDFFVLFLRSSDPVSPIYIMFLPLIFFAYKKFDNRMKILLLYCGLSLIVWYFTPRTGGGRFILPYLPAFSILAASAIAYIRIDYFKKYLIVLVFLVGLVTLFYRGAANFKYLPVAFGTQSKHQFLSNNLNFDFGDFYDTDGWFSENIKESDKVLLIGFHNLYYVDFPFIHESYLKPEDSFNHIATQNTGLPKRYKNFKLVYENDITNVKVYKEMNL